MATVADDPNLKPLASNPNRAQTFADDRVYIPPTDDDEDTPQSTSPLAPTHNQPTASRYMRRILHTYHGTPSGVSPFTDTTLKKPTDFHTLTHWIKVYIYAVTGVDKEYEELHAPGGRFAAGRERRGSAFQRGPDVELQNLCMDVIREYFRNTNSTASAFRLENLYGALKEENEGRMLKDFLVQTAVFRIINEGLKSGLQGRDGVEGGAMEIMKGKEISLTKSFAKLLENSEAVATDLIPAMANASVIGAVDPRTTKDEAWHVSPEEAYFPVKSEAFV